MKTKHLFGLVAVVALTGFAASAQAGWSVGFSFSSPVWYAPPVAYYRPPVTYCPPPVVYAPVTYRPVVYVVPGCGPNYGYRAYPGQGPYRGPGAWNQNVHGYSHGGHR